MRQIVLQFQSNEEAEAFVAAIQRHHGPSDGDHVLFTTPHGILAGNYNVQGIRGGVEVLGLYPTPTLFCDCVNPTEKSVRGEKWGWWIHAACGKPKKGIWQYPRNLIHPKTFKELTGPGKDEREIMLGIQAGYESPHQLIDLNVTRSDDTDTTRP